MHAKQPGVDYIGIKKLQAEWAKTPGTVNKCMQRVVIEPNGLMQELVVGFIYDSYVVFEQPNGKGGTKFIHLSYEQVEFPKYSLAARGIAFAEAQKLFPSADGKPTKRQRNYAEDNWRNFYNDCVVGMRKFEDRQDRPLLTLSMILEWSARQKEIAEQLKALRSEAKTLRAKIKAAEVLMEDQSDFVKGLVESEEPINDVALQAAVRKQCAVTFSGPKAVCICKEKNSMDPCRFAADRLSQVIAEYLGH